MTVQQKKRTPKERVRPGENSIHYIRGKQKARAPVGCTPLQLPTAADAELQLRTGPAQVSWHLHNGILHA